MTKLSSFSAVIVALGDSPALAELTGIPLSAIKMWKSRDTIPPRRFDAVVSAARTARVKGITFDLLYELADRAAEVVGEAGDTSIEDAA